MGLENQKSIEEDIQELKEIMLRVLNMLEKKQCKPKEPKEPKKTFGEDSPVYTLASYLFMSLLDVNESFKKKYSNYSDKQMINLIQKWCDPIDKLMRIDNQSYEDIFNIITGVVNDDFWSTVILSTSNLRKNFTKLYPKFAKKYCNKNGREVRTLS